VRVIPLGLPASMLVRVEREAQRLGIHSCEVVRIALAAYFMPQGPAAGLVVELPPRPVPRSWWRRLIG